LSSNVQQSPSDLIKSKGDSVELVCLHSLNNYNIILWYRNIANHTLELMGYLWNKKDYVETNFTEKIEMNGDANKNCTLVIKELSSDDSTVYFCAASVHSDTKHLSFAQKRSLAV
ncbi:hypothetical protein C0J45_7961, partial [Silurus meridionalis]